MSKKNSRLDFSGKPSLGPARPPKRASALASSVRAKGSKLTPKERLKKASQFKKRIKPLPTGVRLASKEGKQLLRDLIDMTLPP